ncbi:LacI family DNA-binding transcriptional regulator [Kosmotoga pacifica]|uniref:LacI family DNA-binding transcriptional regulator n=1 Tax=Kosmotoga pacifica TaxID=1330330 RepID=UPI00069BE4FD|nr:LacI family DNA-binding transcriptional regulator [Kosmotoga pacifica]
MKIRTKDVARIANVSTATVSRVINGSPNVSEKTRQRVLMAIESLNYKPDVFAKNLAKKRFYEIGIGCPDEVFKGIESSEYQFYVKVFEGIQDYFSRKKCNYSIFPFSMMNERDGIEAKDGFLLVGGGISEEIIEKFQKIGKPFVLVDQFISGYDVDCVISNGFDGEYKLIKAFLEKGYRRIAYIHNTAKHFSYEQRMIGYRRAMNEKGLLPIVYDFEEGQDLKLLLKRILNDNKDAELIAVFEDRYAIETIEYLRELGKKVPEDLGVLGFDNIMSSISCQPPLTTVHVPKEEMGSLAAKRLFDLLNKEDISPVQISLFTKVLIRESTQFR